MTAKERAYNDRIVEVLKNDIDQRLRLGLPVDTLFLIPTGLNSPAFLEVPHIGNMVVMAAELSGLVRKTKARFVMHMGLARMCVRDEPRDAKQTDLAESAVEQQDSSVVVFVLIMRPDGADYNWAPLVRNGGTTRQLGQWTREVTSNTASLLLDLWKHEATACA